MDYEAKFAPSGDFLVEEDFTATELGKLGEGVGLAQFVYRGSLEDARNNLEKGRPVIALIERPNYANYAWLHLNNVPVTTIWNNLRPKKSHWVVIVGMVPGKIILHDPTAGMVAIPKGKFESLWQAKKNTCLLLVPPTMQSTRR
jgi:alanine-alpha-ketoisovalerate/valine-pyruvate aminotransferase